MEAGLSVASPLEVGGRAQRGVTLVEVLVALLILAFVALGVTSLLGIAMKQNKLALERSVATGLASSRLDQLGTARFQDVESFENWRLPEETPEAGPPPRMVALYGEIPGFPDYRRTLTLDYDVPVPGMLRAQVDVGWWNHGQAQEKVHTMITYLHPALGERP
jgi:prepilin-type N-terminal cleavage/methylation domain-containing protein